MYRLSVLYETPSDPAHFRSYYSTVHLPLVRRLPGIRGIRYSFDVAALNGDAPFFAIFEAEFDSAAALMSALNSPEGQAAAGDIPNYASGGATIIHYPLTDCDVA